MFSSDGTSIVTVAGDGETQRWSAATGEPLPSPTLPSQRERRLVVLSEGGERALTESADDALEIWDLTTGAIVGKILLGETSGRAEPPTSDEPVRLERAAFSASGARVLLVCSDGVARLRESTGDASTLSLKHSERIDVAAFSPDETRVVTASPDDIVRIWDAKTGESRMDAMWLRYLRTRVRGCLPISSRVELLGETDQEAMETWDRCQVRLHADGTSE